MSERRLLPRWQSRRHRRPEWGTYDAYLEGFQGTISCCLYETVLEMPTLSCLGRACRWLFWQWKTCSPGWKKVVRYGTSWFNQRLIISMMSALTHARTWDKSFSFFSDILSYSLLGEKPAEWVAKCFWGWFWLFAFHTQVGVFDATNSTIARRNMLMKMAEGKCKVNSSLGSD